MTAAIIVASYLLGSIPTGLWLGLWLKKVNIREHGSKNIGATNTLRVLGKPLGATALIGDMAKGAIPVLFLAPQSGWQYAPLACGLAAILGHTLSIFIKFKGGKGVATSSGVFFALAPLPMAIALGVFIVVVATTRMVSLASMVAGVAMAIAVWIFPNDIEIRVVASAVAALVVFRHRDNIQRILSGTENKL
jgi:glycerol-3-phosphate acyltransferase PlsY